jgi:hypothetical protein
MEVLSFYAILNDDIRIMFFKLHDIIIEVVRF